MRYAQSWNESEILVKLQHGDERAFERLYEHYSEIIYGRLLKLLKDPDLADEIIQDLFLKIWDKRESIDHTQSFKSYLYKIAENLVYDHFRKVANNKKMQEKFKLVTTELYTHTEEDLLDKESRAIINKAIDSLPPQRKMVFILCKVEGKSYEEASEVMGISVSTVSNHLVKAVRSVREYISNSEDLALVVLLAMILTH